MLLLLSDGRARSQGFERDLFLFVLVFRLIFVLRHGTLARSECLERLKVMYRNEGGTAENYTE